MRARSSEFIVNHTIRFIEEGGDSPFVVNVWLNDTHAILDPTPEQMEVYTGWRPQYVGDQHWGAPAIYFATATEADRQIGRLMDRLEELGLAENTIFIFSADNGPEDILVRNASHSGVGSPGPFRGRKRSLYEGGIRTPFILRWPGRDGPKGNVDNLTPLCGVDLLPTLCSLAGVETLRQEELDGEDMSDVFRGVQRKRRTPLMWEWRFRIAGHSINKSPLLAIREGDWKLLLNPERDRVELYRVLEDPMELTNRAAEHAELVDRLADRLLGWQAELPPGPYDPNAGSNRYPWPE
jgi:N-acetylgalactosamine-6-sulfatase